MKRWKVAGINFDHFHMGDNLRMAAEHPDVDVVAICDEQSERMRQAQSELNLTDDQVFTDYEACLGQSKPDLVLLCPSAAEHGIWTQRVAPFGVHMIIEKPFAATLGEADTMIAAVRDGGGQLAINWPMAWYATNQTAYRLIREGSIGEVLEVHYYDGNRGPLWHAAGKENARRNKSPPKNQVAGFTRSNMAEERCLTTWGTAPRWQRGSIAGKSRAKSCAWWTNQLTWRSTNMPSR